MTNIIFPDVSFWQDDNATTAMIDFATMRTQTPAVIIRAGQNTWADTDFKANWEAAKAAGLLRGAYWFYDSRADPKRQAELWASLLDGDFGELPLWCDFEDNYNGSFKGWRHWYNFIVRLQELAPAGKTIGIYTAYYYWLENVAYPKASPSEIAYFKQFPLWIANYGSNITKPLVPAPWGQNDWLLWQFTDNGDGALYGVESKNIDLNYFNGDEDKFSQMFGSIVVSEPNLPTEQENDMTAATHNCKARAAVKVREQPHTANASTKTLAINEKFQISAIVPDGLDPTNPNKKWGHIFGGRYDGLYTALEYPGNISPISTYEPIPGTSVPIPDPIPDPVPVPDHDPLFAERIVMNTKDDMRAVFVFERYLEEGEQL